MIYYILCIVYIMYTFTICSIYIYTHHILCVIHIIYIYNAIYIQTYMHKDYGCVYIFNALDVAAVQILQRPRVVASPDWQTRGRLQQAPPSPSSALHPRVGQVPHGLSLRYCKGRSPSMVAA